jgi:hypothetical protein
MSWAVCSAIALEGAVRAGRRIPSCFERSERGRPLLAKQTDHLARQGGRMFKIVFRAGGTSLKMTSSARAHRARGYDRAMGASHRNVVDRQLHRVAQAARPQDDVIL